METDALTFLFILIIILIGYYLKQLWISFIFVIILGAFLLVGRKKAPKAVPRGGGTKIRPIIIKRKYVGPKSIYPEKMKIKYSPDLPKDWREYGPEPVGKAVGTGIRWLKNLFK